MALIAHRADAIAYLQPHYTLLREMALEVEDVIGSLIATNPEAETTLEEMKEFIESSKRTADEGFEVIEFMRQVDLISEAPTQEEYIALEDRFRRCKAEVENMVTLLKERRSLVSEIRRERDRLRARERNQPKEDDGPEKQ